MQFFGGAANTAFVLNFWHVFQWNSNHWIQHLIYEIQFVCGFFSVLIISVDMLKLSLCLANSAHSGCFARDLRTLSLSCSRQHPTFYDKLILIFITKIKQHRINRTLLIISDILSIVSPPRFRCLPCCGLCEHLVFIGSRSVSWVILLWIFDWVKSKSSILLDILAEKNKQQKSARKNLLHFCQLRFMPFERWNEIAKHFVARNYEK